MDDADMNKNGGKGGNNDKKFEKLNM